MTDLNRKSKDQQDRDNLTNENFTIIANNCIGGIIYHNLGLKFMSPTINLWFTPKDYIKLLQHPHDYLSNTSMKEDNGNKLPYPVGILTSPDYEEIKVYGEHYEDFSDLKNKWNDRTKRINWNNLLVFFIERDGCTYEDLVAFDQLPYKKKLVFTKKEYPELKNTIVLPNTYNEEKAEVKNLCDALNALSEFRDIDRFDYVKFINNNQRELDKRIN